jgi:replication fork protection complex subunit Csm3/Swi3
MARLLNFYQLWLDDLFPRAKFADGLAMIEKLGHSKRVQIMRKEWIGEDKPTFTRADAIVEENTSTEAPNHGVQEDISQREIDMVLAELEESES